MQFKNTIAVVHATAGCGQPASYVRPLPPPKVTSHRPMPVV